MNSFIKVERFLNLPQSKIGRVFINNKLFCYSEEDEARTTKDSNQIFIPDGVYSLGIAENRIIKVPSIYKHEMISITGVPNNEILLFHYGFLKSNLANFLVIGDKIGVMNGNEGLLSSKATYFEFHQKVFDKIKSGSQKIAFTTI